MTFRCLCYCRGCTTKRPPLFFFFSLVPFSSCRLDHGKARTRSSSSPSSPSSPTSWAAMNKEKFGFVVQFDIHVDGRVLSDCCLGSSLPNNSLGDIASRAPKWPSPCTRRPKMTPGRASALISSCDRCWK
ncbi:hypothetical protein M431DRAFT_282536 [Trichoderma harzianum CBS 226.95]|uniref:Uncharacterized protein n=1 Tax=Trichoderma harzianum CBS 226.95 TaxID=983964 RepID=A0A2T4ANM4_TRIHA|nr:hypothetical protein M431DRAFT_282536 [Trichoderma harzianum CBS 226.95]PTB58667.1 hypothetical protein M431DRAFT_282536 [Trichoderma harzianum CBS 226.95]